jgi:hypothetical protein
LVNTFILFASPSIQGFRQEGTDQDRPGLSVGNASASKIKHLLSVELADRSAVATFHVVREYFQLGLRVNLGVRRQQQGLVHLVAVGLLGTPSNLDLALENAVGTTGEHVLDGLARRATRRDVADDRGEIAVLRSGQDLRRVQVGNRSGAAKLSMDLSSREARSQVKGETIIGAARFDVRIRGGDMEGRQRLVL